MYTKPRMLEMFNTLCLRCLTENKDKIKTVITICFIMKSVLNNQ